MLQNLSGKASIVGRSLSIYKVVKPPSENDVDYDEHDDELVSCCVIARDDPLTAELSSKDDVKRAADNYWDQFSHASAAFNPKVGHFTSPQSS